MTYAYKDAMPTLLNRGGLEQAQADALMSDIMVGDLSHPQIAAVLTALAQRTATADELVGFATVMRRHARGVPFTPGAGEPVLDTCGTGGSGLDTANTSTMAAFVLAGAGVTVAKHGNRSSSGRCGSMDVLERVGVHIEASPESAADQLRSLGLTFLFAPLFHPAVGFVMPVRRELGFRTVFNFLGPLCNPANPSHQVLGVSDKNHAAEMAKALCALGVQRALVVHGDDGLDELTLQTTTTTWLVADGGVTIRVFSPEELGLTRAPIAEFRGGDTARNATLLKSVLRGESQGAHADHLALNVAAGLWITGRATTLKDGVGLAKDLILGGVGWTALERFRGETSEG